MLNESSLMNPDTHIQALEKDPASRTEAANLSIKQDLQQLNVGSNPSFGKPIADE